MSETTKNKQKVRVSTTKVTKKTLAKVGRPTKYTQEIADEICALLSIGQSIRTVCKPDHMPSIQSFYTWLRIYPEFLEQYARAKEEAADAMAEDILDIADDGTNDWTEREGKDGSTYEVVNSDVIQRSKLRVDTRKWLMAKMKPRKYGDKIDHTTDGKELPAPIMNILVPRTEEPKRTIIEAESVYQPVQNDILSDVLSNDSN